MPSVKAMSNEDWHKFLRCVKEDKQGVVRMHKLIQAGSDSKKSQFHHSSTSRLGKFFSDKEKAATKTRGQDGGEMKRKRVSRR